MRDAGLRAAKVTYAEDSAAAPNGCCWRAERLLVGLSSEPKFRALRVDEGGKKSVETGRDQAPRIWLRLYEAIDHNLPAPTGSRPTQQQQERAQNSKSCSDHQYTDARHRQSLDESQSRPCFIDGKFPKIQGA